MNRRNFLTLGLTGGLASKVEEEKEEKLREPYVRIGSKWVGMKDDVNIREILGSGQTETIDVGRTGNFRVRNIKNQEEIFSLRYDGTDSGLSRFCLSKATNPRITFYPVDIGEIGFNDDGGMAEHKFLPIAIMPDSIMLVYRGPVYR